MNIGNKNQEDNKNYDNRKGSCKELFKTQKIRKLLCESGSAEELKAIYDEYCEELRAYGYLYSINLPRLFFRQTFFLLQDNKRETLQNLENSIKECFFKTENFITENCTNSYMILYPILSIKVKILNKIIYAIVSNDSTHLNAKTLFKPNIKVDLEALELNGFFNYLGEYLTLSYQRINHDTYLIGFKCLITKTRNYEMRYIRI